MTDISDKRQLLHDEVSRRKLYNRFEREDSGVPRSYFVFSLVLIPVCVLSGMFIVEFSYMFGLEEYEAESDFNYSVDDYSIIFVSPEENEDMEGADGFTYTGRSDDIFIRKELLLDNEFDRIKVVCEHELMHNLGLPSQHHEMIDIYEEQVSSPVCEKLMEMIR